MTEWTDRDIAIQAAVMAVGLVVLAIAAFIAGFWPVTVVFGIAAPFFALRAWQFCRAAEERIR